MSMRMLITIAIICMTGIILPACTTPGGGVLGIPATDLNVVSGPCGTEFHGVIESSTDIAIGKTGYRWEQTTNTKNRIYQPCTTTDKDE